MKGSYRLPVSFLLLFFCFTNAVKAQNKPNRVKGRVLPFVILPYFSLLYSVGAGYERMMGEHFSAQLLLNSYGVNFQSTDGAGEYFTSLVPEMRYYLNNSHRIPSSFFLAGFVEFRHMNMNPGGEQDSDNYLLNVKQREVNPGLMLGKNFKGFHRFYLETYVGAKYRFGQEEKERIRNMQAEFSNSVYEKWGMRLGANVVYRF